MSTSLAYAARATIRPPTIELVWDIECVSNWDTLPERARRALNEKYAKAEARLPQECRNNPDNDPCLNAALNPWTGRIVALALYDPDRDQGRVLFIGSPEQACKQGPWRYEPCSDESELLEAFWATLERNPDVRLVGFNSRNFDAAYVFVRSFVNRVYCTMNVLPYRYSTKEHLDMFDVLGGWGANRCPSLEVVCEIAGIESSKKSLSGHQVQAYWDEGRILEIAEYCAQDVRATAEIAAVWDATVGGVFGERRKAS